jgi:hypothetical protein
MNINSKEKEYTANSTLTSRRTRSQKTSGSLRSKMEVFIWRDIVYIPKSWKKFCGILICAICRPRDKQEYYSIETPFRLLFKKSLEKTEYYCNISVGSIKGTTKTLDDLGCFDLKIFRNCPIRIEIITGSHIFILFLPRVVTLCLHFPPRTRSW